MKYTDNGIVFDNVKEIAKYANIDSNARYSAKDYDYDDNGNPRAPKFLINAIDIDWNGAKPEIGEDNSTGITTTGELLTLIKKYADTTVKNSLIGEDGNRWPTQKTLYGVKDYADGVQSASYNKAEIEASNVLGKEADSSTDYTVYGVRKYAEIKAQLAYTNALNNAVEEANVYTNTEIGRLEDNLIGASTDASTADTIWGAKKYADKATTDLLGTYNDDWLSGKKTIYGAVNGLIGYYDDSESSNSIWGAKNYADVKDGDLENKLIGASADTTINTHYGLKHILIGNTADTTIDTHWGVKNSLIGSNEYDTKDSITIWGARKHADDIEEVVTHQADSWSRERANNAKTEAINAAASDAAAKDEQVKIDLIGSSTDASTADTIWGAKNYTNSELAKLEARVAALESAFSTLAQNVGALVTIANGE